MIREGRTVFAKLVLVLMGEYIYAVMEERLKYKDRLQYNDCGLIHANLIVSKF